MDDTENKATAPIVFKSAVEIDATRLQHGMFVFSLDRPWESTPFLLQGFVVRTTEELATLRKLCKRVVIDPRLSVFDSVRDLDIFESPEPAVDEPDDDEPEVRIRYLDRPDGHGDDLARSGQRTDLLHAMQRTSAAFKRILRQLATIAFETLDGPPALVDLAASGETGAGEAATRPVAIHYLPTPDANAATRRLAIAATQHGSGQGVWESQLTPENLVHFQRLIHGALPIWDGLLGRLGALFERPHPLHTAKRSVRISRKRGFGRRHSSVRPTRTARPIDLVVYRDRAPIESEIRHARASFEETEVLLGTIAIDLDIEGRLSLDGIPASITALVESAKSNPDALVWLSRVRSQSSRIYGHGLRCAACMLAFGRHMGFPPDELNKLALVGLFMDIGKLRIDPAILDKPGALSAEETVQVHRHVGFSLDMLGDAALLTDTVRKGIAEHHEWIDGTGYPNGLAGEEISMVGRMAAIVDAYSAMTSMRSHAKPLSSYDALRALFERAGTQFHEPLVEQFVQSMGLYPVGSLVLLSSEVVAVVVAQHRFKRLQPRVLILTDPNKIPLSNPVEVNLLYPVVGPDGKPMRILRSLPTGAYGIDFRNFYIG